MIGKTLGHYQVVEKLGAGGMGVVYKARDLHLDRFVALKILSPEKVADANRKRRFTQEAKAASSLNHTHIVHIYDISSAAALLILQRTGLWFGDSPSEWKSASFTQLTHYPGVESFPAVDANKAPRDQVPVRLTDSVCVYSWSSDRRKLAGTNMLEPGIVVCSMTDRKLEQLTDFGLFPV